MLSDEEISGMSDVERDNYLESLSDDERNGYLQRVSDDDESGIDEKYNEGFQTEAKPGTPSESASQSMKDAEAVDTETSDQRTHNWAVDCFNVLKMTDRKLAVLIFFISCQSASMICLQILFPGGGFGACKKPGPGICFACCDMGLLWCVVFCFCCIVMGLVAVWFDCCECWYDCTTNCCCPGECPSFVELLCPCFECADYFDTDNAPVASLPVYIDGNPETNFKNGPYYEWPVISWCYDPTMTSAWSNYDPIPLATGQRAPQDPIYMPDGGVNFKVDNRVKIEDSAVISRSIYGKLVELGAKAYPMVADSASSGDDWDF